MFQTICILKFDCFSSFHVLRIIKNRLGELGSLDEQGSERGVTVYRVPEHGRGRR